MKNTPLKIALVHDYLREYGGAERVLEALHELYPEAPVYVAFVDEDALGIHWERFKHWDIRESVASKIPFIKKLYSPLRVLSPYFFEGFDFSEFDVVISSTNMYMAKGVLTHPGTVHICYCHTPPRSLYGYSTMTDWKKNPVIRVLGELINFRMRALDFLTAQRPDLFIANSEETQRRIKKFYKRESQVIYPPVSLGVDLQTRTKASTQDYYLFVGRLAKSKRADLAIEACVQLGRKLKFVGAGKGEEYLRSLANDNVEFLGGVSDTKLAEVYAGAKALLFPADNEDFGIVPVEAMMAGVPVIAHNSGGPKETVVDGKTGVLFDDLTTEGMIGAIERFETLQFKAEEIKKHAQKFSKEKFMHEIVKIVEKNSPPKQANLHKE